MREFIFFGGTWDWNRAADFLLLLKIGIKKKREWDGWEERWAKKIREGNGLPRKVERREFLKEGPAAAKFFCEDSLRRSREKENQLLHCWLKNIFGENSGTCVLDFEWDLEGYVLHIWLKNILEGKSGDIVLDGDWISWMKNLMFLFLGWRWSSKRILEKDMNSVVERKFEENSWRRPKDDSSLNEVHGRKTLLHSWLKIVLEENLLHTIFWFFNILKNWGTL